MRDFQCRRMPERVLYTTRNEVGAGSKTLDGTIRVVRRAKDVIIQNARVTILYKMPKGSMVPLTLLCVCSLILYSYSDSVGT